MPSRVVRGPVSKAQLTAALKRIDEQLEHVKSNRTKLEERAQEYEDLKAVLEPLPEKIAHPVMVPFGPMAFFEGQIERTNEVLTQLSSEWFALRTTKGALEMVGRRQARLQRDLADVKKEENELRMRRRAAVGEGASDPEKLPETMPAPPEAPQGSTIRVDDDGFLDIREPLDEGDASAAPAPATIAGAADGTAGGEVGFEKPCKSGDDILARLKELERLEELEELENIGEEAEQAAEKAGQEAPPPPEAEKKPAVAVKSPADLFRLMSSVERGGGQDAEPKAPEETPLPRPAKAPEPREAPAFSGSIVERAAPQSPAVDDSGASQEEPPKRVSKFKADRQRARG